MKKLEEGGNGTMVKQLTENMFDAEVAGAAEPVIVDFYADWCGPCKMMGPIIEDLSNDYGDRMNFYKCNVDENGELSQKFGIMSIPTVIIFKGGEAAETMVGAQPKEKLEDSIKKALGA